MEEKFYDEEFLSFLADSLETEYYTFGTYYDYNGMDVKNIKNPIFNK